MKIVSVRMWQVQMHLKTAFQASTHAASALNHIVIAVEGAGGVTGWGESAVPNDPYYMGETVGTAWSILGEFLIPAVLGREWTDLAGFTALWGPVKANQFAKAGLEMAAWDLLGRETGQPVARLLGGTRDEILSGVSLGIEKDAGRLFATIDKHLAEGYRRVKLKIAPGHDATMLATVRERYPDTPLMVDANSAYTLADAEHLKTLDRFGLMMIEQPLAWDDIIEHAALQAQIATPVCLDESIRTPADARNAIALRSGRVINIKVARVGGLLDAKRVHDLCHAAGIPVWCGGMHDYGIARAANIAIASLPGFTLPGDISGSDKYFAEDIVDPPVVATRGAIPVPTGPGLGYTPLPARIESRSVRHQIFGRVVA